MRRSKLSSFLNKMDIKRVEELTYATLKRWCLFSGLLTIKLFDEARKRGGPLFWRGKDRKDLHPNGAKG